MTDFRNRLAAVGGIVLAVAFGSGVAQAVPISGSPSDFEARLRTGGTIPPAGPYDPGPSTTAATLRSGFQTNFQITSVYFFQLPALNPGESVVAADFAVTRTPDTATSAVTPTFNADLVALGFTNTAPPDNTAAEGQQYFFIGEGETDPGSGVGGAGVVRAEIQDNFFVPSDFVANGGAAASSSTSAAGDANLLAYINALYANQAVNGFVPGTSSLVLRLNPDALPDATAGATQRYTTASADSTEHAAPTLTLDIIPEPSAALLLGLSGLGLLARRRR